MNFLKLNYIHYLLIAFTLSVFFFVYIAINNSDEVIGDTMIIDNLNQIFTAVRANKSISNNIKLLKVNQ